MPSNKRKLINATNALAKYYGVPTLGDIAATVGLNQVSGADNAPTSPTSIDIILNDLIINTSDGAPLTIDIIKKINDVINQKKNSPSLSAEEIKSLRSKVEIYFGDSPNEQIKQDPEDKENYPGILSILGIGAGGDSVLNSSLTQPSKQAPNLSVILSNTSRVSLTHRNVTPSVIFMNGIPNTAIARAVPIVDIEFFFPRPALNTTTKRIQSLSLAKFLLGAEQVDDGTTLSTMTNASNVPADIIASSDAAAKSSPVYSSAGMELFTAPQTLVNADIDSNDTSVRANPILDKFRPLMTIRDLELRIIPSKGFMSYKSGTLNLTLHDRSRLAEVAELIRADLYGKTEILIEYGWHHPANGEVGESDPYGDLINGMRLKEKYQINNSSFAFTDSGEVEITLSIVTRGTTAFNTELISSKADSDDNPMKEIEDLQKLVAELRKKVFPDTSGAKTEEIRGVQILNAAQDATSHIKLTPELKKAMTAMTRQLGSTGSPESKALSEALTDLLGMANGQPKNGEVSAVDRFKKSIIENINKKIEVINTKSDPFLKASIDLVAKYGSKTPRGVKSLDGKAWTQTAKQLRTKGFTNMKGSTGASVSLGMLFLLFVGEPLAATEQFDEVQLLFYPFNDYAGAARQINIANFSVDLKFFIDRLFQYRLGRVSKSGNMTLGQFLNFISEIIVDDPAAESYGLNNKANPFFKRVTNKETGVVTTQMVNDVAVYQDRLNNVLKDITPDGTFKQARLKFHIETLGEEMSDVDGTDSSASTGRSVLRIHILDQLASSYDTLGSILSSTRNDKISVMKNSLVQLNKETGNKGVVESTEKNATAILKSAEDNNLLERINEDGKPDAGTGQMYRIKGGSRELKTFMMNTMPYIIFGAAGTTLTSAKLASFQNSKLSTINLMRSFEKSELEPNGENPGGIPMRIIPSELNISMLGCPLIDFTQQYFVDFQTGTTADNIYSVVGITHKFEPGSFETDVKFTPADAWGTYVNLIQVVDKTLASINDIKKGSDQ